MRLHWRLPSVAGAIKPSTFQELLGKHARFRFSCPPLHDALLARRPLATVFCWGHFRGHRKCVGGNYARASQKAPQNHNLRHNGTSLLRPIQSWTVARRHDLELRDEQFRGARAAITFK